MVTFYQIAVQCCQILILFNPLKVQRVEIRGELSHELDIFGFDEVYRFFEEIEVKFIKEKGLFPNEAFL